MSFSSYRSLKVIIAFSALTLGGCNNSSGEAIKQSATSKQDSTAEKVALPIGMDISMFADEAFTQEPEIVDCETAEGTKTTCYQLVTSALSANIGETLS